MIKSFIVALSALISFSVFAAPRVGDSALYVGTAGPTGTEAPIQVTQSITGMDSSGKYIVHSVTTFNGQDTVEDEATAADDITSEDDAAQIVQYCSMAGGVLESITVKAGSFNTCNIQGYNVAAVPFGLVKGRIVDEANGVIINFELASFSRGH